MLLKMVLPLKKCVCNLSQRQEKEGPAPSSAADVLTACRLAARLCYGEKLSFENAAFQKYMDT